MFTLGNLTICEDARSSLVISLYSSLVMRIHKLQSKNVNLFLGWASTLKSGQIMPAGLAVGVGLITSKNLSVTKPRRSLELG